MGNCCDATSVRVDADGRVQTGPQAAERLVEIPGAEVVVMSGNGKQGVVIARGPFQIFLFRAGQECTPGQYRLKAPAVLGSQPKVSQDEVIGELPPDTLINVLEVVVSAEDKRLRGRIKDPPGWISLQNTQTKARSAQQLDMAVLYVGDNFGAPGEEGSFYYPTMLETPMVLVYESRLLTLDAGDGDAFAVRLPQDLPGGEAELDELIGTLSNLCNFRLEKQKDAADYTAAAAGGVAGAVGKAAQGLSKAIQFGGSAVRAHTEQKEEVKVGAGTKMAVKGAKVTTGASVKVAGAVIDGLLGTAVILGKEAGKRAAPESASAPAGKESGTVKAGKAALFGGLQVFDALIKAGDQLAKTTADETAGVVGHRYGKDAGAVTREGMAAAGDVLELQDMVGKKAVGKLAVKGAMYTAQGVVEGAVEKSASKKELVP